MSKLMPLLKVQHLMSLCLPLKVLHLHLTLLSSLSRLRSKSKHLSLLLLHLHLHLRLSLLSSLSLSLLLLHLHLLTLLLQLTAAVQKKNESRKHAAKISVNTPTKPANEEGKNPLSYPFKDMLPCVPIIPMLHVSYIIPSMALWHLVFAELSKHKPQAVSKNITHLLHSLVFLLHYSSDHDLQYATHISLGFYIYDTACLMQTAAREFCLASTEKIMHRHPSAAGSSPAPFLLHHAIAIYMLATALTAPQNTASLLCGYYILETSNIMLCVSYHVRKEHAPR